ncbi:MAG: TolC family protein [Bacteroidota bacterium]
MRLVLIIIGLASIGSIGAQVTGVLSFDDYMDRVREHHPVTYQADLLSDMAASTKRIARGGFDPKIEGSFDHKSFNETNYYALSQGALKVPTWYGVDLKAGYDRSSGQYFNNSDFLPSRGLWNLGISVPLGKGFVIDERRAALQRADIYRNETDQERIIMVNQVLYDAATNYLNWQVAWEFYQIALEGQELATLRFEGTKVSYQNGDVPAIDTLESFISLQSRQLDFQKAVQDLENTVLGLNNFLWEDGVIPLEVDRSTRPSPMEMDMMSRSVDSLSLVQDIWLVTHPELLLYDYKIDNLNLDQRLAREELKPDLRVQYNPLVAVAEDALFDQFSSNNFKLGVNLSYPILQRKERGKIALNDLKIRDTEFERTLKNQDLSVKLDTYRNNINQTQDQLTLIVATVENYNRMLIAENRKFQIGESSIFLVNTRENKYLESRYKRVDASRKLLLNRMIYLLFSGQLGEVI